MIRHFDASTVEYREHMRDGDGTVELTPISNKAEMYGKVRLFSRITLKPGCGIGYHTHENEEEIFYIVSGKAIYNDNGTEVEVVAGDTTVCPSGEGHGIRNAGDETVELIALIPLM